MDDLESSNRRFQIGTRERQETVTSVRSYATRERQGTFTSVMSEEGEETDTEEDNGEYVDCDEIEVH